MRASLYYATPGIAVNAGGVQYNPPGAGSVSLDIQTKVGRELYSVFDRMSSDQKTDVLSRTALLDITSAVQAEVDRLPATGGIVKLPCGVYKISRVNVQGKSNVWFVGETMFSGSYNSTTLGTTLVSTNGNG